MFFGLCLWMNSNFGGLVVVFGKYMCSFETFCVLPELYVFILLELQFRSLVDYRFENFPRHCHCEFGL